MPMSRLSRFWIYQRAAWRALFRRRVRTIDLPMAMDGPPHPSVLCRCNDGAPADALADHMQGCEWLAMMCKSCGGTGWCERCGGDGTAPGPAGRRGTVGWMGLRAGEEP